MKTSLLIFVLLTCCSVTYGQVAYADSGDDLLAFNSAPTSTIPVSEKETPRKVRRTITTETPIEDAKKFYLTAGIFPTLPGAGDIFWLEYGLSDNEEVVIELFDPRGYTFLLCQGERIAGVKVEALQIPPHLESGTYYLKIKAGNGRAVVPLEVK
ncbi:MAG: hypothetical protein KDC34_13150 [Saprospiraceae bacterium]|nr:hypothetical protein [Saprospiraceae bacterium]